MRLQWPDWALDWPLGAKRQKLKCLIKKAKRSGGEGGIRTRTEPLKSRSYWKIADYLSPQNPSPPRLCQWILPVATLSVRSNSIMTKARRSLGQRHSHAQFISNLRSFSQALSCSRARETRCTSKERAIPAAFCFNDGRNHVEHIVSLATTYRLHADVGTRAHWRSRNPTDFHLSINDNFATVTAHYAESNHFLACAMAPRRPFLHTFVRGRKSAPRASADTG